MNFHFAPLFAILPDLVGNDRLGLVTGIEGSMASVGAFTFPALLGYLRYTSGLFCFGWHLIALLAFSGAILSLSLRRYRSELPKISTG